MAKSLLIILALSLGSLTASASLMLEPYAGYASGTIKGGSLTSSDTISGVDYGARLGIKKMGLMVGAEYMGGQLSFKDNGTNYNFSQTDIGAFIGYQFPLLGLRIYGTYFISPTATMNTSPQTKFKDSWAGKVGIGWNIVPYIAINIDYYTSQFKQSDNGTTSNLSPALKASYVLANISVPITLF